MGVSVNFNCDFRLHEQIFVDVVHVGRAANWNLKTTTKIQQ